MSIDPTFGMPFQRFANVGSFNEPVAVPSSGPFDGTVYQLPCVNAEWIRLMAGALTQLVNPSTWQSTAADNDTDTLQAVRYAQELLGAVGSSVMTPCCAPPVPTTPVANQACNISGYLANFVIKEAILQAVQAAQQNLTILGWGLQIIKWIPGISLWYIIFSTAIIDFFTNIISGTLTDYETALGDDSLWSQVACAIYGCISADNAVTEANFPCIQTALCSLTYPLADVKTQICNFVTGMGAGQLMAAQSAGIGTPYTCDCGGAGIIGPGGHPAQITSGKTSVLIAAGNALGTASVSLLRAYGAPPILLPVGNNPIMIPAFSSVTTNSFDVEVQAPRAVDVDTTVDVDWTALPVGMSG